MMLRELRISKGITQKAAAEFVGIPLRTYSDYENRSEKCGSIKYKYIMEKLNEFGFVDEENGLLSIEDIKRACAARAVEFVRGEAHGIAEGGADGNMAKCLNGIHVQMNALLPGYGIDVLYRLDDAGFIVGGLQADQAGIRRDGGSDGLRADIAGSVRIDQRDAAGCCTGSFQDAVMLNRGEDDMAAGKCADDPVVGFRTAAGEVKIFSGNIQHRGDVPSGHAMNAPGVSRCAVCAGGVIRLSAHAGGHGADDGFVAGRGCGMIQIDGQIEHVFSSGREWIQAL